MESVIGQIMENTINYISTCPELLPVKVYGGNICASAFAYI